jgi:hypothetical protein
VRCSQVIFWYVHYLVNKNIIRFSWSTKIDEKLTVTQGRRTQPSKRKTIYARPGHVDIGPAG